MAYHQFSDWRGGIDLTAPAYAARVGTLTKGDNGHITRAGHFEARPAFVLKSALPPSTFGCFFFGAVIYVFGSVTAPVTDSSVQYMRCVSPSGSPMTGVNDCRVFNGQIYVSCRYADGVNRHFYGLGGTGTVVTDWYSGASRTNFDVLTGGGTISSIKIDGIEVLGGTVTWTTSNTNTAALIVAQINSYASLPDYTAYANGQTVYIVAPAGTQYNDLIAATTVTGTMTVSVIGPMAGGVSAVALNWGDKLLPLKNKMYALMNVVNFKNYLYYSAIATPTSWSDTQNDAGFLSLGSELDDNSGLNGLAVYYRSLVVFGPGAIIVLDVFSDDTQNTLLQTISGIGLVAPRATLSYQSNQVFFLSKSGIRALQARDASNYAIVVNPGARIDALVSAQLQGAFAGLSSIMLTEPSEGRLWCIIGSTIYVYSYFQEEQIACWTTYSPGFTISDATVSKVNGSANGTGVYVRSGDNIYSFNETLGVYDASTVATLRIPFTPAMMPDDFKDLTAADFGLDGEWKVSVFPEVTNPTVGDLLADVSGPSLDGNSIDLAGHSRYFALEFVHQKAEYARVATVGITYEPAEAI